MYWLEKINLPKNLKEISTDSFFNCGNLTNLTIPSTITALTFFVQHGLVDTVDAELLDYYKDEGYSVDDRVVFRMIKEDDKIYTFEGCQKLPVSTRLKLAQLGYKGEI
jgi:hypothetical protein